MIIKDFKEEYVDKCTELGLYGKAVRRILKITPVLLSIYVIVALGLAAISRPLNVFFSSSIYAYMFWLYLKTRKEVQKNTGKKIKGLRLCTPEIQNILDNSFKELMKKHKISSKDKVSEKRLDDIVRILNNYSDRLKYDWLIPSKILIFLLPGIWAVLLVLDEKISIINDLIEPIKQKGLMSNLWELTLICGIFLLINWLFGKVIFNSSSDDYKELANKVDEYRLNIDQ